VVHDRTLVDLHAITTRMAERSAMVTPAPTPRRPSA
jgi:hypothetical protein